MTIATEVTTTSGNLEVPLPRSPLPDPGGAERSRFFLGPCGLLGGYCARIFLYQFIRQCLASVCVQWRQKHYQHTKQVNILCNRNGIYIVGSHFLFFGCCCAGFVSISSFTSVWLVFAYGGNRNIIKPQNLLIFYAIETEYPLVGQFVVFWLLLHALRFHQLIRQCFAIVCVQWRQKYHQPTK